MFKQIQVVLDTNLFVAAYFNPRSNSAEILNDCLDFRYHAIFTPAIIKEANHILTQIKVRQEFKDKVEKLIKKGKLIKNAPRVKMVSADPQDDKFLSCSAGGGADYLITSDEHLLEIKKLRKTKIVKPSQFLRLIAKK